MTSHLRRLSSAPEEGELESFGDARSVLDDNFRARRPDVQQRAFAIGAAIDHDPGRGRRRGPV
jgi:hypothetical protein